MSKSAGKSAKTGKERCPPGVRKRLVTKKNARWNGMADVKDHRREAILPNVANVLRNSRLSSLTIQQIAYELGMTKGNLYYYFKDKQNILFHCHIRSAEISLCA